MDQLCHMIQQRRSVRKYTDQTMPPEVIDRILDHFNATRSLYPDIRVDVQVVQRDDVRFYLPWKTPQLLAVYSEVKPGYLENVGFRLQRTDLYIQSLGLGSCWLGLGKLRERKPEDDGMEFVILMAFGQPDGVPLRFALHQFQRKSGDEIMDIVDERLEPARLAPSSTNSQPWYFTHEGDVIHAYCSEAGALRHRMLGRMHRIDMGIALAHMYVSFPDSFRFFQTEAPLQKGHRYIGSFTI